MASTLFSPTVNRLTITPPTNSATQSVSTDQITAAVFKLVGLTRSLIERPTAAPSVANMKYRASETSPPPRIAAELTRLPTENKSSVRGAAIELDMDHLKVKLCEHTQWL